MLPHMGVLELDVSGTIMEIAADNASIIENMQHSVLNQACIRQNSLSEATNALLRSPELSVSAIPIVIDRTCSMIYRSLELSVSAIPIRQILSSFMHAYVRSVFVLAHVTSAADSEL